MKERTWKQQRCSSADEWVNVVHSDKETVFGSLKRNEPLSKEKTWEKLKCILLNEKNQSKKTTYWWLIFRTLRNTQTRKKFHGGQWRWIGATGTSEAIQIVCIIE